MSKGKAPALMLYTGDWLKDPELSACSPATRGVWADWLCRMREQVAAGRRPRLSVCVDAFARLGRCSSEEALQALMELQDTDAASVTMSRDVTLSHAEVTDVVTLENRRMSREWRASRGAAERQRAKRDRDAESRPCYADVTTPLSSSSSIATSEVKKGGEDASPGVCAPTKAERDFDSLAARYPNPVKRAGAKARWCRLKAADRDVEQAHRFLDVAVVSEKWTREGGRYIPGLEPFVNGKIWQDPLEAYPPARGNGNPHAAGPTGYEAPDAVEGYVMRRAYLDGLREVPESERDTDQTDEDLERYEAALRVELAAINADPALKAELRAAKETT